MSKTTPRNLPAWAVRVKEARGELSQEAFARNLGVAMLTVSRWERGLHQPSWGHANRLSRESGKPAASFLVGDDEEETRLDRELAEIQQRMEAYRQDLVRLRERVA